MRLKLTRPSSRVDLTAQIVYVMHWQGCRGTWIELSGTPLEVMKFPRPSPCVDLIAGIVQEVRQRGRRG